MVFSSITFIFYFLPIFLTLYYVTPYKFKNIILLVSSLIFYSWGEPKYIFLMIFSSVIDYIHALIIEKNRNNFKSKLALLSSIIINLGILFYFKYTNFFLESTNKLMGLNLPYLDLVLPIGISFYTFQTMSYTIDVYKGEVKAQNNILSLATYVTLFPQLVAGPIVRYKTVASELEVREHSIDKTFNGLMRFLIGLSKKVIIANNIGFIWECIKYSNYNEISLLTAWLGIISFALQIYFDFSGYSDMAIGLGTILGFNFQENFNYPYISTSVSEFWRRWHISMGTWFKDYIYIPLGGNSGNKIKWLRNIFIVWMCTGFWHGAGVNYIAWGLYFAIILIAEKTFLLNILNKAPKFLRHIYVFVVISISWVIFELSEVSSIKSYISSLLLNTTIIDDTFIYLLTPNIAILTLSILAATPIFKNILKKDLIKSIIAIGGFLISISYLVDASFNPFLYFRF